MSQIYSYSPQKIKKREKVLILLSGGLDSVTTTYWAVKQGYKVEALFFDFEHTARDRELECAMDVADHLDIQLHVLKVPLSQKMLQDMIPLAKSSENGISTNPDMGVFTGIIVSWALGASYALASQMKMIAVGVSANNVEMYAGLQSNFFQTFQKLVSLWTDKELRILTPFLEKDKSAIIKVGIKLGVPFQHTWSCSASNERHCGRCPDCLMRVRAFAKLCLKDPIEYKV